MIFSIESDLPTFKPVQFHKGLNVILADKFSKSDDKKTRNSAGKTSLVEIVNFLYGSKAEKGTLLRNPALERYTFFGQLQVGADTVEVGRKGGDASRIWLGKSDAAKLGVSAKTERESGRTYITNEQWKEVLAHRFFGFPRHVSGTEFAQTFTPGFRPLFGYFARRDNSGAFQAPEKSTGSQSRWDYQENLSYILGLDWHIPFDLQRIRDREGSLKELKRAASGGMLGSVIGTVAELRPAVAVAEAKCKDLREQLNQFRVMDSYREMSDRASRAKAEMQAIERRAVSLKERLLYLKQALEDEAPPQKEDVARVYRAIGIELPDTVRRRFEDVERFHKSVVENRRHHLREEIASVESQIAAGETSKAALDTERSQILRDLRLQGSVEGIAIRPGRERSSSEATATTMKAVSPLSASAQSTVAEIEARLPDKFSRTLLDGAVRVLADPKNDIRLNQFATAFRELCTHILHTLAPDADVRSCPWFPAERARRAKSEPRATDADLDRPTRRQRAIYAKQGGITNKQLIDFKLDVDGIHKEFLDSFELLNRLTHVKPDTIVTDHGQIAQFTEEALKALLAFYGVLDHCRETISEAIVNAVHNQAFDELTRETIGELDLLSTHTYVEGPRIDEIAITSIDSTTIHYRVTGDVDVELNYGSGSDFANGDGASMGDSYPFTMSMSASVADPRKFQDIMCEVDTSSFYE